MRDDLDNQNSSIEHMRENLIRVLEDQSFRTKIYRFAFNLTKDEWDAEDYEQEAYRRFISVVKSKKSLEEIKDINPLPYVYMIVKNIHKDVLRKAYTTTTQRGKTSPQGEQTRKDTSERPGSQKFELLAARLGMSIEDIANHRQEASPQTTQLEVEEKVVSEMVVEAFINSLPEELRELTRLLVSEDYQLRELLGKWKLSYEELKKRKKRIREALYLFQVASNTNGEVNSSNGR